MDSGSVFLIGLVLLMYDDELARSESRLVNHSLRFLLDGTLLARVCCFLGCSTALFSLLLVAFLFAQTTYTRVMQVLRLQRPAMLHESTNLRFHQVLGNGLFCAILVRLEAFLLQIL